MMLKKELAAALGISGAMVTKLAKRGMPTDTPERAQRWRRRHLEPGRVKGMRIDTIAPAPIKPAPPPRPSPLVRGHEWLSMAIPPVVAVQTVEAVGEACAKLIDQTAEFDEADYPLAFLRDLIMRTDADEIGFRLPGCVWIRLLEYWLHKDVVERLKRSPPEGALDAKSMALLVGPGVGVSPFELLDMAADADGISVTGWPAENEEEPE